MDLPFMRYEQRRELLLAVRQSQNAALMHS